MVGLSPAWRGVIQDTASTATLVALICARERVTGYALTRGGLQAEAKPLAIYVSAQSHSSVDKAALLAGFGRDNVRLVPCDAAHAMRPDAFADDGSEADMAAGITPCALVAHHRHDSHHRHRPGRRAGRWWRGRHGHLAAFGRGDGRQCHDPAGVPLDVGRRGAARTASSSTRINGWACRSTAHSITCAMREHLVRVMSTNPSFLQSSVDGQVRNLRDWGIPLGRRFRALKLWFTIREQGVAGLQARLRRDMANARALAATWWRPHPAGRSSHPSRCRRSASAIPRPAWMGEALDAHTRSVGGGG